jgi:hypothetical protein
VTGFLIAAGAVVIGIGATLFGKRRGKLSAHTRYLPQLRETLEAVEKALGMRWKGREISLSVLKGEFERDGYWQAKVGEAYQHAWTFPESRAIGVAADPATMWIFHGTDSGMGHEVAHRVMESNGIPWEEHHKLMKKHGILWEQR